MEQDLKEIYYSPNKAGSFGGINNLYQSAKLKNPIITRSDVKNFLLKQNAYTLHKPARKHFTRNKI